MAASTGTSGSPRLFLAPKPEHQPDWVGILLQVYPTTNRPQDADYIVVIGGDGALLHSIHRYSDLGKPFLGLNAGYRGFLMNDIRSPGNIPSLFDDIHREQLWLLEADVDTDSGVQRVFGFNDIWVERETGQTLKMRVTVDGVPQPAIIFGDGMLFSTPQGSTGYNRALRGKVILPGVPVIQMTPMSCVVNKVPLGSLLLSETTELTIEFDEQKKRPCRLFHDGIHFARGRVERFTARKSDRTVDLMFTDSHTFRSRVISWQFQL